MARVKSDTKKSKLNERTFIDAYMEYVLENGERPKSIYRFAKDLKVNEQDFYKYFGSFDGLRQRIWEVFFENTMKILQKDGNYQAYDSQEKMLAFFYTFFEILTANRSYVILALKESNRGMQNLKQLQSLRNSVKDFAKDLIRTDNESKSSRFTMNPVSVFSEGAWIEFLFLLKYWMDDNSPEFEKTDMAIEKSVKAIFDIFNTSPLESVLDFGKFLLQDSFRHKSA